MGSIMINWLVPNGIGGGRQWAAGIITYFSLAIILVEYMWMFLVYRVKRFAWGRPWSLIELPFVWMADRGHVTDD